MIFNIERNIVVLMISLMVFNPSLTSQADTAMITLAYEWDKETKNDFYISEIIDRRKEKSFLGFARKGAKDIIPVVFKDGMNDEVQRVFDKILPHSNSKRPLKAQINRLWVGDDGNSGTMELSMEFFEKIDNKYVSIGVSHQFIYNGAGQNRLKHQRNIRKGLVEGIKEFAESDQKPLKDSELLDFSLGIDTSLKVGSYRSYDTLIRNQKQTNKLGITRRSKRKIGEIQYHVLKEKKRRLKDYAYYDGKYLFLNNFHIGGSNFDYLNNQTNGRYLVYVNKVKGTNSRGMFGLLGALVDAATEKKRISVLDLKSGSLMRVDDTLLNNIFSKYVDLHPGSQSIDKYTEEVIVAFQNLNERLRSD